MLTGLALTFVAALLAIAPLAVALLRTPVASSVTYGASGVISLALLAVALVALLAGTSSDDAVALPLGLPWIGAHFRIDPLAAAFLVILNFGGATASLYGIGHGAHEHDQGRVLPFFPAFLAAMNLVVLADDAFTFLLSWESMSLASWALVMAHHREAENRFAGLVYLVMASFGTLSLVLAFGLLAGTDGHYAFAAIRAAPLTPLFGALVVALAILGAGSKAGLVPLHVWLPLAHPAAPSHVSALMSGVMTKVAIYAFIRIVFDLVPAPPGASDAWAAAVIIALGAITAVLGILYAILQTDTKKMLAYSTVENVGVIFVGLGLALAFRANAMPAAAALAMTAALLHAFNHSLFKSALFYAAGAVLSATGLRDMEKLGGLIHRMPETAFVFLVAAAAISALPPLNGFASEWLTFQAILLSPALPEWSLKLLVPAAGGLLALAAALAAAAFVRAFGITFLGRARSPVAAAASETDRWSLAAMFAAVALCVVAGLFPGFLIDAMAPAVTAAVGAHMPAQMAAPWLSLVPVAESHSSYNGLIVFLFVALSGSLSAWGIHRLASRAIRRAPAWDGGFPDPSPLTQYSAGSFAEPIRRVFTPLSGAVESVEMPPPGSTAPARFRLTLHDPAWEWIYTPVATAVAAIADRLNPFQFLTIRRYLSLVFAALVLLLLVVAVWA
ncbi:MAG TPA: hydrogenase 4 subunit B [Bauldia sp.]|nr:hydrogenase 4 subunit B [Bauldia sp.]